MASFLPEPLRMILTNPAILDLSSNGPLPYALRQHFTGHPPPLPPDLLLACGSVLITGATAGVGLEAARQIASSLSPRVLYIGARDLAKAEGVSWYEPWASILLSRWPGGLVMAFLYSQVSQRLEYRVHGDPLDGCWRPDHIQGVRNDSSHVLVNIAEEPASGRWWGYRY
ncbi:hypothetical protein BJX68DRAFT_266356 [Aspergillus pseudodeflectus]|uniref:Ketoreductase (KR) domain-containing protein n=1 Tax=Aspergillus pseudodeflectus TaxID=176178 RepID=A0ABR4KGQ6_9EURO